LSATAEIPLRLLSDQKLAFAPKNLFSLFASGIKVKHSTPVERLSTTKKSAQAGLQSPFKMIYDSG
jgi:hypothetical protein